MNNKETTSKDYEIGDLIDLLREGGSIIVNKRLAKIIGLHEAIIYSELISRYVYFKNKNRLTEDGYFFNTIKDLKEGTTLSDRQQRKAIDNIKEIGLIFYRVKGMPARRYFKINPENTLLLKLLDESQENQQFCENGKTGYAKKEELVMQKGNGNNTNINNTNSNNTNLRHNGANSPKEEFRPIYTFKKFTEHAEIDQEVKEAIEYYLKIYEKYMRCPHPNLKAEQWFRVVDRIFVGGGDYEYNRLDELGLDEVIKIIDKHFKTDYDSCDYNILHFISGEIIQNRFYEVCY